jgi:hypothetical protein
MKQAKLRSIGISTAVELFDAILREPETVVSLPPDAKAEAESDSSKSPGGPRKPVVATGSLSALFKLQVLRAIGVAIVKRQRLYILLLANALCNTTR